MDRKIEIDLTKGVFVAAKAAQNIVDDKPVKIDLSIPNLRNFAGLRKCANPEAWQQIDAAKHVS